MTQNMYSSELELGKFLGSIDLISYAFRALSETSSTYQLHTNPSGLNLLAFKCPDDYTNRLLNGEFDLVSSELLDFISTKDNPSFSINKAAVDLFKDLPDVLKDPKRKLFDSPLVVTGWSVGGYLAILFALWLQHAVDVDESISSKKTKRPICITFGSPLVGDEALQQAIGDRPQWKSRFLNVIMKTDPVASFFSSNTRYKPLGTSLFCTKSGGHSAFEDQEAIMAVLDAMAAPRARKLKMHDYANVLSLIQKKVLYSGVSELGEFNLNPLRAGITLQFREIDVSDNSSINLIGKMEEKQAKMIIRKKNVYEPTKKLNQTKKSLACMELYKKKMIPNGGYYDSYKNPKTIKEIESQQEILIDQRILNQYWIKFVEENERLPQKECANLRKRWLYGGTTYRRIVEPLDIAEYYKKGDTNYMAKRSNHYKLLEKWWNQDKKDLNPSERKGKAASLTEDSCFWAYVEEAVISLRDLTNGGSDDIEKELERFEADVMRSIKNYSLSSEIFLKGSNFMKWWSEYKSHKGSLYASNFAQFMNTKRYESYTCE